MYYVAFWNKTSGVIPHSWLNTKSRTFRWPRTRNPVVQIIKADKPKDDFYTYHYTRICGPYETYDDARDFELDALNVSTNDEEGFASIQERKHVENILQTKRNIHKPQRYCTTSSGDEIIEPKIKIKKKYVRSSSSSETDENDPNNNNLPPPPANYITQKYDEPSMKPKETKEFQHKLNHRQDPPGSPANSSANNPHPSPVDDLHLCPANSPPLSLVDGSIYNYRGSPTKSFYPFEDPSRSINSDLIDDDIANICIQSGRSANDDDKTHFYSTDIPIRLIATSQQQSHTSLVDRTITINNHQSSSTVPGLEPTKGTKSQTHTDQPAHEHCCCQELLSEITTIKKMVSGIYMILSEKNNVPEEMLQNKIDFGFQIQSKKQLIFFEEKLKNPLAAAQYKTMVKHIGGKTFEKHIRNALSLTLSDVIAYRMSWTGAKNTIKVQHMKHVELIKDVILNHWTRTADSFKIEEVMKSWLQHAGDRIK